MPCPGGARRRTAYKKFEAICRAQGRFRSARAHLQCTVAASHGGRLVELDNRKIAQIASSRVLQIRRPPIRLHVRKGDVISTGQPLMTLHAVTETELAYALAHASQTEDMLRIES
jgi:thymidine phosphorylase